MVSEGLVHHFIDGRPQAPGQSPGQRVATPRMIAQNLPNRYGLPPRLSGFTNHPQFLVIARHRVTPLRSGPPAGISTLRQIHRHDYIHEVVIAAPKEPRAVGIFQRELHFLIIEHLQHVDQEVGVEADLQELCFILQRKLHG